MIKRELLDRIPLFKGLSQAEKNAISEVEGAQFIKFDDQEYIIHEGDMDDSFYILLKGNASVLKAPFPDPVAKLDTGEIFGEIAFLSPPRARTASIRADGGAIALRFNRTILMDINCELREKLKDRLVVVLIEHLDDLRQVLQGRRAPVQHAPTTSTWFSDEESAEATIRDEEGPEIKQALANLPGTKPTPGQESTTEPPMEQPPQDEQRVLYEGKDGYRIIYCGGFSAILENQKKQKFVEMVELSREIPKNFKKAIEGIGHSAEDYLFGDNYVIPAAAKRMWDQTLIVARSQLLEQKQKEERFQKIDLLYM